MRNTFTHKLTGLTQADGPQQIDLSPGDGSRFHQIQIVTTDVVGTVNFRLQTPGSPETFIPVDESEVETFIDFSKINRVVVLCGFSELIEVIPDSIVGTYDVYTCSGGE